MGSSWKAFERWVASLFWTFRNSLSGSNNRSDDGTKRKGDVIFKHVNVEAKNYKNMTVDNWMQKAEDEADVPALLVLHKKKRNYDNSIVAMPVTDWLKIREDYLKKVAGMDQEEINELKERWEQHEKE